MSQADSYAVMGGFLQKHAYQNVWCTPNQDKQAIFKPQRLTDLNGAWINYRVMWANHTLPDNRSRFHVYQIGQIHPLLLGLDEILVNGWIKLSDACNLRNLIAHVYTVRGVQIHRTQVWYKITPERALIFAIRIPEYNRIPVNMADEEIFIHLYSNAFYQSDRANLADNRVYVEGTQVVSNSDILAIQQQVELYKSKPIGAVTCFVNGFITNTIDMINSRVGDYVEFVFDGSVKRTVTFKVSDLNTFESVLDNVYKYLLHYPGDTGVIEYQDDVDVSVIRTTGNRFRGVYFHKNNPAAFRMVTHKDYSVPTMYLQSYVEQNQGLGTIDDIELVIQIRNSGYNRPLVYDNNRIYELYKLDDDDLLAAMIGINSTVDVWKAANLENSAYVKLMGENLGEVTPQKVQDAYGYNAISKLIADTPQRTVLQSNKQRIEIPPGLAMACTVYEYDADGLLLGYYPHNSGSAYVCVNDTARLCEVISGIADIGLGSFWDVQTHAIDPNQNYRFYTCGRLGNVIDDVWVDVTNTNQYTIINGQVTWFVNRNTTYTLVRPNTKHIAYTLPYMAVDGLITFSIREWREDLQAYRTMAVPMGELDIFLNKHSLIEGLDYIVDFPRIIINNKEYLNDPDNLAQQIVIRFTNFCNSDLTRPNVPDVGFVQYGVLSYNNRYDIREDKVNRIIVDGALYRYDELEYGEQDFDIHVTDARNGAPYAIRDIIVPMNDYLHRSGEKIDPTLVLREQAIAIDKAISDYMTLKIPEKETNLPSAIPALYKLVSPFFNRIIHDLNSGALWEDKFIEQYSDQFVRDTCQRYEYLLSWDPVSDANLPDQRFVIIHPHNSPNYIDMQIYQYKFLTRVVGIYGSGRIALSNSVRLAPFGNQ